KAFRIKKLARAADKFEEAGNLVQMANMLEKVAKEIGGAYTNRYEHTGKGGGPIKYEDVTDMTTEQLESEADRLWTKRQSQIEAATATKH
ncbi:hypothetical protein LCGC14_2802950, partial [marine sediment metagenome]